ncbi:ParA family protein [Orenia marismortui]|uniref:Chromosome partitioning protein n=1 Tax=Orenia marismortui TaxID=46469 RepID=A0A4R8GMT4_9FIRM|nr:ParA family protein [Orenia marismortui]TDX43791.1 chromosome partitioning protein [Orenia marismortui]
MHKIAIYNNKGGVGKSTLAVHLADALRRLDLKILLVDLDSQNDCSLFLGLEEKPEKTFFNLIDYRYPADLKECIIEIRDNLGLLTNTNYELIEKDLHRATRIDNFLDKVFEKTEEIYDYMIIDCSPSRSILNSAILFYVDSIIVPTQLEIASIRGFSDIYNYLEDLDIDSAKVKLVVPNMFDTRTKEAEDNLNELKSIFDEDMITSPINRRTKITEASKAGKTIFEYNSDTQLEQFYNIVERVIELG